MITSLPFAQLFSPQSRNPNSSFIPQSTAEFRFIRGFQAKRNAGKPKPRRRRHGSRGRTVPLDLDRGTFEDLQYWCIFRRTVQHAPDDDPAWSVRRPHLTAQMRFLDPDVLGLQEALPHQVVEMAAEAVLGPLTRDDRLIDGQAIRSALGAAGVPGRDPR
jgi:hypothetical protein